MKPVKTLRLINLRAKLDALTEREKQCRADMNRMRRGLAQIFRERKAAYITWELERAIGAHSGSSDPRA